MKKLLFILSIVTHAALAQNTELVDDVTKTINEGKSYIYLKGVKLKPPAGGGTLNFNGNNQSTSVKPADPAKLPTNIPPSMDQNFVRRELIQTSGVTSEDQISSLFISTQRALDYSYADQLGRPNQTVTQKSSPAGYDGIKYFNYDANCRISQDLLPFVTSEQNGAIKANPKPTQESFYSTAANVAHDSRAFVETEFENSPLNRVNKAHGPGDLWKNQSTSKFAQARLTLNNAGEVRRWYINGSGLPESVGTYDEGVLMVTSSTNEDNLNVLVYRNAQGNVVMKNENGLITYYVYDGIAMLRFVLPPELSKLYPPATSLVQPDQNAMNTWAFQYIYDERLRLSEEKGPGTFNDWIYYVYDQWDRLVARQDGVQRNKSPKEWSFSKFDELNRLVMTGTFKTSISTHAAMISAVTGSRFETENSSAIGYTLTNTFPNTNQSGISSVDVKAISYFDDYSFLSNTGWTVRASQYSPDGNVSLEAQLTIMSTPKGKLTATKILGATTDTWFPTVFYYDLKYNPVLTVQQEAFYAKPDGSVSNSNTADRIVNTYDFTGKVLYTYRTTPAVTIRERYEYDPMGRMKNVFHSFNGTEILLASFSYNELGQVVEKNLHSTDNGASFLQSVDYRYNIRGWMTSINNSQLANDGGATNNDTNDLFGLNLVYNQETLTVDNANTVGLYDGRISAVRWKNNNLKETPRERAFNFTYDSKARFDESKYGVKNGSAYTDEAGFYNLKAVQYDDNGNIKKLTRYAKISNAKTMIDDLTYGYGTSSGNQLTTVEEGQGNSFGYPNATTGISPELQYDKNGNVTSDLNSQVVSVTYNELNLPENIQIDLPNTTSDPSIVLSYDASGVSY